MIFGKKERGKDNEGEKMENEDIEKMGNGGRRKLRTEN